MQEVNITITKDDEDQPPTQIKQRFIVQLVISIVVITGCAVGLVYSSEPYSRNDIFLSIIASIVGLYLPSPKPK